MFTTNVPYFYWGEAILTAAYLINRLPSKPLKFKTPLSILCDSYPDISYLSFVDPKVFGRIVYVHNHNPSRSKLDPRALKCIFLGYSLSQKGYKCYCPTTHRFYISTTITFYENLPFYPSLSSLPATPNTHHDPIPSLPPLALDLPVYSQGGASQEATDNTLVATPTTPVSLILHTSGFFSKYSPTKSRHEKTASSLNPTTNNPLFVYSKRPKGHPEPNADLPLPLDVG